MSISERLGESPYSFGILPKSAPATLNIMCLLVIVGNYSCGHQRSQSHGLPHEFVRECEETGDFHDCDLLPYEEDIPWLCPDCHWAYVQHNLAPLWQQTTITKCRVLQDAEMFPTEPSYRRPQRAADHLRTTFEAQQKAVNQSAIAYHELRDETLRAFLGEDFRFWMMLAHQVHRPWSLSYLRDPFVRARSNMDLGDDSSSTAETIIDPPSGDPPVAEAQRSPGEAVNSADHDVDAFYDSSSIGSGSDLEISETESEVLTCRQCQARGSADQINANHRLCRRCWHTMPGNFVPEGGLGTCIRCQNPATSVGVHAYDRLCEQCREARIFEQAMRTSVVENRENGPYVELTNDNALASEAPLHIADLSMQPMGAPSVIPPAHRGTLAPFLAARRENRINVVPESTLTLTPSPAARQASRNLAEGESHRTSTAYMALRQQIGSATGREARRASVPSLRRENGVGATSDGRLGQSSSLAVVEESYDNDAARQRLDPTVRRYVESVIATRALRETPTTNVEGDSTRNSPGMGRSIRVGPRETAPRVEHHYSGSSSDEPARRRRRLNPPEDKDEDMDNVE